MPRARITEIRPVARDTITATTAQMRAIAENPHTDTITDLARVGPGYVRAVVTRVAPVPVRPRRRLPVTFTVDPAAARAARKLVKIGAKILTSLAALSGAAWLTWELWGAQITHALGIFLGGAGLFLSVISVAWLASSKAGVCPGYHCPGCPHRK